MATDDNVLFMRTTEETGDEDIWDDTALIKAYDKSINLAKEEVLKRLGLTSETTNVKTKTKSQKQGGGHSQKSQKKWCIGSPCRAVYSEDGELYEAVITKIFENTGSCLVKFIGYNNKEKVELSSLLESEGLQSQIAQQKHAATVEPNINSVNSEHVFKTNGPPENSMECDEQQTKSFNDMYPSASTFEPFLGAMPPAPPLPPQLMARLPENDADALSSMLMSWYISGFHTGYYHGLKQAQKNEGKRK